MQKLHFSVFINAPADKVWNAMLEDATYREWTKAFEPDPEYQGSRYEGSWEKGAKILFLSGDQKSGMVSRIAENKPYEFISIEHIGIIKDGVEDTTSEEATKWSPAFENYTFVSNDGGTELLIDVDVDDAYKTMFEGMWPKALADLKKIAER